MLPCRRFADVLADACARLGADVGRYSFIAVDFHHILLAGLPAHSLALRPAHSRRHQIRDNYPGASDISSPPCLPRLLPAGAVAGWASHPLENAAFHGARGFQPCEHDAVGDGNAQIAVIRRRLGERIEFVRR
jgi:hypothetical protein